MKNLATAKIKYKVIGKTEHCKYLSIGCSETDSLKTIKDHFESVHVPEGKEKVIVFDSVEFTYDVLN
jgi:hypothetical protein